MFVYYYSLVRPTGSTDLPRLLLDVLRERPEIAAVAYREGEEIRARLRLDGKPVAKTVRLDVGEPRQGARETTIPISWEATGTPGLFPRMIGEFVVSPLGTGLVQLILRGTYHPPLGGLGEAVDRLLLHRVAETSVKTFVDRVAAAVNDRAAEAALAAAEGR